MRALDAFCGEGGTSTGLARAGFQVVGVDKDPKRLEHYPYECQEGDAIEFILRYGQEFELIVAGPTCTGYSRGTAAIHDRLTKYDRLIAATREAILIANPAAYLIENVADARHELRSPVMLCGRQFGLTAVDDDGTPLVMDRHRMFESDVLLMTPPHETHDPGLQVAGSYGGGRRNKWDARHIRKGGYVPKSVDVQRALLGTPWMTERGCQLSIPPIYTEFLGTQLMAHLEQVAA